MPDPAPYFDEKGEPVVHPLVAQVAQAFGRADLAYVLDPYFSLRFYRGLAPFVTRIRGTCYGFTSICGPDALFVLNLCYIAHYERLLRESVTAEWPTEPGWMERGEGATLPGLVIDFTDGLGSGDPEMRLRQVQRFREVFLRSVTVPVPVIVRREDGSTRSERLLLFLSGPLDVAHELSCEVFTEVSQRENKENARLRSLGRPPVAWDDDYLLALNKCAHLASSPFEVATLLRAHVPWGRPEDGMGFPLSPPVFDYLAALDEAQRATGITSLSQLEAEVGPPAFDGEVR